jgi:predicted outer membrane repeat protein
VADTTANTIAIQAKLARDGVEQTVCLSGNFVINDQIDFVGTKHIKGVGESSSIKNPLEAGDIGENNVFTADFTNSMNVITIENLTFKETAGYAVFAHEIVVTDGTFSYNGQASIVGYSITATNSTFIGNTSGGPSGSAMVALVDVDVTGSTFTENTGGTIVSEGSVNVTGSTFIENSSPGGGAIYSEHNHPSAVIVSNSTFSGNLAPYGGAISAIGVSIENSTFENNMAIGISDEESNFGGLGGAIKATTVVAANSTFVGNIADGPGSEGGAIFAEEGGAVFSTFLNNEASVPVDGEDVPGNAIYKAGGLEFVVAANIFAGSS